MNVIDDLPRDLARPRHDAESRWESTKLWAGIITGGVLIALNLAMVGWAWASGVFA